MRTTDYDKCTSILELYVYAGDAERMPERLAAAIKFFRSGHEWYKKNRGSDDQDKMEFQEYLEMLLALREMSEAMLVMENKCIILREMDTDININPFLDFLRSYTMTEVFFTIRGIKEMMVEFLHPENLTSFTDAQTVLSEWELFFVDELIHPKTNEGHA